MESRSGEVTEVKSQAGLLLQTSKTYSVDHCDSFPKQHLQPAKALFSHSVSVCRLVLPFGLIPIFRFLIF